MTRTSTTQHCHQPWFDTECRNKHKEVSSYAKLHPDNHLAREWKKQLKQLLRRKKRTYKKLQGQQLCALAKTDPANFWRKYSKNKERSIVISKADLVAGFQKLLEEQCPNNTTGAQGSSTDQVVLSLSHPFASDDFNTLNCNITLDEIVQVMRRLKRNKSASLDGIKAKFLLNASDMLHVPLQIVFNKLLQQGYSAGLSTGAIHALHKGGDALQFENYRGITVGHVLAKVFAMILEARLSIWAEERGLRARGQVGFRKDFRPEITCTFGEHSLNRTLTNAKRCIVALWTFAKLLIQCLVICYGKCWLRWELWVASCSVYRACTARTASELCIQQKGYRPGSYVALRSNKAVH
jgi:hypothetical protein